MVTFGMAHSCPATPCRASAAAPRPRGCDRLSFRGRTQAGIQALPRQKTLCRRLSPWLWIRARACQRARNDGNRAQPHHRRPRIKSATPRTRGSAPARPPSCSTSRRSPRSTCAAAGPARAKPRCSIRRRRSRASTPSRLSGGSAFGLDAASGVQAWLREQGRGFAVRTARVPIVPAAILFDLLSGGDKNWGRFPPYRDLGYAAAAAAGARFRPRQRRRRHRSDHGQLQRRNRLGLGANARRPHRRCARRGQRRRQRRGRRRSLVLGGAVRARRRVRRPRVPVHRARRRA